MRISLAAGCRPMSLRLLKNGDFAFGHNKYYLWKNFREPENQDDLAGGRSPVYATNNGLEKRSCLKNDEARRLHAFAEDSEFSHAAGVCPNSAGN